MNHYGLSQGDGPRFNSIIDLNPDDLTLTATLDM